MKKERPILFSTPMVKAVLDGNKIMTRRIKGLEELNTVVFNLLFTFEFVRFWDGYAKFCERGNWTNEKYIKCPYGNIGDVLWVRESFMYVDPLKLYLYKADDNTELFHSFRTLFQDAKWKPSIHMPKEACRLRLEIIDIRVERLHDISEEDAVHEGVEYWNIDYGRLDGGELVADFKNYTWKDDEKAENYFFPTFPSAGDSFKSLWISINKKESWDLNPWVWVITFNKTAAS